MKMLSTARLAGKVHFWGQQYLCYTWIYITEFISFSDLVDWGVCLPLLLEVGQSLQTGFGDNLVGFMSYISPKLNCLIFFFPSWKNERSAKIFVLNPSLGLGCVSQSSLTSCKAPISDYPKTQPFPNCGGQTQQWLRAEEEHEASVWGFLPGCARLVIFSCSLFFMASSEFSPGVHQSRAQFCVYKGRGKMMRFLCLLLRRQLWGGLVRSKKFLKGATAAPGLTPPWMNSCPGQGWA